MKFVFLTISHKPSPWLEDVLTDYQKKLSYWFSTEVQILKSLKLGRDSLEKKKAEESLKLFGFLKPDDFVIVCDEGGKSFNSRDFSKKLENILNSGKKRLVLIVGGAYGVEQNVLSRADLKLSLSTLTLNHPMALALILEQTYRAMTLIKGIKYHND